MEFSTKVKGKVLGGQSREILANIIQFMRREAEANSPVKEFTKVQERVAMATGVSIRTVQRVEAEMKQVSEGERSSFSTPGKKRIKLSPQTDLDDFDEGVLRRFIISYRLTDKKIPTLRRIHKKFMEENGYTGSVESLRKAFKKIGFRWRKTKTNRKILMEKPDIQQKRLNFLRSMKKFRQEKRPIIYMDETYIHSSHTHQKSWSDDTNEGHRRPVSKGQRLIIVHAGSENGFVPNAYLGFKSQTTTGDYHNEMNYTNYKKWLQEKLIPNLPARSVLVIDNAPYHNVEVEKSPNFGTRKEIMKEWLRRRNIPFTDDMLKVDLYTLIKLNKPRYKTYEIDAILRNHGHDVLRLPPYHPDLNPIELVWASLKQYVADRNIDFNFKNVEKYCEEFFSTFTKEEWESRCEHVKKIEQFYIEKEAAFDLVVDEIIINLLDDDSDVSDSSSSDTDSDNDNTCGISGVEFLQ